MTSGALNTGFNLRPPTSDAALKRSSASARRRFTSAVASSESCSELFALARSSDA